MSLPGSVMRAQRRSTMMIRRRCRPAALGREVDAGAKVDAEAATSRDPRAP
jgi:hypothetical protein